MRKEYAFVDEIEALRPLVEGPASLERYQYWLDNFRYLRAIAEVRCVWAQYNAALEKVKAEKNPDAQKKLARELALPIREKLVAAFAELNRHLLATVSGPGEMGNVCNWQQQTMPFLLTAAEKRCQAARQRSRRPRRRRRSNTPARRGFSSARFARASWPARP